MLRRTVLLGLLAAAALVPASAHAAVVATPIGNFTQPTYMVSPPGDTHRLFVVQQDGVVKEIKDGGAPTTFLDISSLITDGWVTHPSDPEQGLLSIAFPPDYETTHHFFAYYTTTNCPDTPGCDNVLAEFTAADDDTVTDSTPTILMTIPHPTNVNHDGGQLQFGPDGDLYVSVGDGGGNNDFHQNAQTTTNVLGKILRIAPTASGYTIPADNPFKGNPQNPECTAGTSSSNCPEIWWYGVRNPWRFSFDSSSGALLVGDVGQSRDEELDYALPGQDKGGNFGWPCYEGNELNALRQATECSPLPTGTVLPVLVYHHGTDCGGVAFCGQGIIGGYVIHDPSIPTLGGCYLFGDLGNTRLQIARLGQPSASPSADLGPKVGNLSSFGEDASGHLYAADVEGGNVYRLDSDGNAATTPACPAYAPGALPPPTPGLNTAPVLKITRKAHQRVMKTHYVKVTVSSNVVATITARSTVSIPGAARVFRLRSTRGHARVGKRLTLHVGVGRTTLKKIRRALHHHRRPLARVTIRSTNVANLAGRVRHVSVRIVG